MTNSIADAYEAALAVQAKKHGAKGNLNNEATKLHVTSLSTKQNAHTHSNLKSPDSNGRKVTVSYGKVSEKPKTKQNEAKSAPASGKVSRKDLKLELGHFKQGRRAHKKELVVLQKVAYSKKPDTSVYSRSNSSKTKPTSQNNENPYTLNFPLEPKLTFDVNAESEDVELILSNPILIQHTPLTNNGGDRDLTVGLDVGTSCVKCVVGDRTIKHAYAIPFVEGHGIDTYLLPSVLYVQNDVFSLIKSNKCYNNLKLGFIQSPNDDGCRVKITAFIALVLRQAIAWFLQEHNYINNKINWALSIGVPAPQGSSNELAVIYKQIARAAWYQAWSGGLVGNDSVKTALKRANLYDEKIGPSNSLEDVEIYAVPEIAAQIHGYVEAMSFDPNARNIYLLVDVGAGTVDSSLFHVKKVKGKSKFSFYESKVESLGVMNLHRARLTWWKKALGDIGDSVRFLIEQINSIELQTESKVIPPKNLKDYFDKSEITFHDKNVDPDVGFKCKLNEQVISTYRGSFKNSSDQVKRNNLYGINAFLCGGGFKMPFYGFIKDAISNVQGVSYLKAIPIELQKPENLDSPFVDAKDYSRLSVAYGLSFIRAEVIKALPIKRETELLVDEFTDNFISKDDI